MSLRVCLSCMHAIFWAYVLLTMDHPGNPFANLGARLDLRARRKTLRLLNDCSSCADVCIAFSGLYPAARKRR